MRNAYEILMACITTSLLHDNNGIKFKSYGLERNYTRFILRLDLRGFSLLSMFFYKNKLNPVKFLRKSYEIHVGA